jgi:hypothetical protein
VALQSLKDLGRLTYRRFLELFRYMVGLLGRVISLSQGLYLHRTTQHRKTRTNIHALSGIRTHDPSTQPAKTHASGRTATVTGYHSHHHCVICDALATPEVRGKQAILLFLHSEFRICKERLCVFRYGLHHSSLCYYHRNRYYYYYYYYYYY